MHSHRDELLLTRLNQYPHLRERLETLLNIVDNVAGDCTKADAAEQAVPNATATVRRQQPALQGNGEKKSGGRPCLG